MIEYLTGRLVAATPGKAIIEVGGVGISLDMPPAETDLPGLVGQEVTLFTRLLVKEEEMYLYAFRTAEERKLFNLVIGVSGFGPRLALSLLGLFTVSQLYVAVLEENITQLKRAHGVGQKAAQRLVLELKEKLPQAITSEDLAGQPLGSSGSSVFDDLTEALISLGYSGGEAATAVSKVVEQNEGASREELLKLALKSMAES